MKIIFAFIICVICFSCKKDAAFNCNCTFDHKTEVSKNGKDTITSNRQTSSTEISAKDRGAAVNQCEQNNGVTIDRDSLPSISYKYKHTLKVDCHLQ